MIEIMEGLPENVVGFRATGKVTDSDYEKVLVPAVEAKIKANKKIRILYHLGPGFDGYTAAAMWDDTKVGLHHLTAWEKVAIVSDVEWIRAASKVFGFAMPGRVRVFDNARLAEAKEWVSA